jgi:hypothetical protein
MVGMELSTGSAGGAQEAWPSNHNFFLCYNPFLASKRLFGVELESYGLKKALILLLFLPPACLVLLSCGNATPSSSKTSGIKYRAFLTNSVSAGTESAGVFIVNAQDDVRANAAPISAGNTPTLMVLTPNRAQTLIFSGNGTQSSDNTFNLINNAAESNAAHLTLPGMTQSFVVSPDSSTAYVAVPTAPVVGQSPGVIEVISLSSGAISATIDCPPGNPSPVVCTSADPTLQGINPAFTNLAIGNTGSVLLAFNQGSGSLADSLPNVVEVVTPSSVQTGYPVVTLVPGFDHPIAAFFNSDDSTAYVLNCGPECGGVQASVQALDLTTNTPGAPVPVPAATVGLVINSTMYLAGTPYFNGAPSQPCSGQTTQATTCGVLTIFDLATMSIVQPSVQPPYCPTGAVCPITITDGYHTNLALGAYGQLYIGSRTCTEIVPPLPAPTGAEIRGCLTIYNTLNTAEGTVPAGGIVIPPQNGDVTGIQPIASRNVVYVIQGGALGIYDDRIDAFEYNPNDEDNPGRITGLVGNFYGVTTIDF